MDTIKVKWGASFNRIITLDDADETTTVSLILKATGESSFVLGTALFNDEGQAVISITAEDMELPLGTYNYQFNVTYENGNLDKYPDSDMCQDCEMPEFIVCESVDYEEMVS